MLPELLVELVLPVVAPSAPVTVPTITVTGWSSVVAPPLLVPLPEVVEPAAPVAVDTTPVSRLPTTGTDRKSGV
ncbi:hypothetical protein, partial [Paraburkholderia sp. Ac-20347]|uniref:hypothetical protein n=1 Tax=Paraburkholderia sp. Ac-20347 TaxID=2703892 RepID=UPI001DCF68A0